MEIIKTKHLGFCFGVKRALDLVNRALNSSKGPIYTLGPLIHNAEVVKILEEKGVIAKSDLKDIKEGTVVFRTHGVLKEEEEYVKRARLKIIDATCPLVKRVRHEAKRLEKNGYKVVIVGDKDHQEVRSVLSYLKNDGIVIDEPQEIKAPKLGVVVQTTQTKELLKRVTEKLLDSVKELKIVNTICESVEMRLKETRSVAELVDMMIVVGGKDSANTKRLFNTVRKIRSRSFQIESERELDPSWFKGIHVIGLTGGTSTPDFLIDRVYEAIKKMCGG